MTAQLSIEFVMAVAGMIFLLCVVIAYRRIIICVSIAATIGGVALLVVGGMLAIFGSVFYMEPLVTAAKICVGSGLLMIIVFSIVGGFLSEIG